MLERLALTVETGTSQSQYSMMAIFKTDATLTTGIIPGASISENIRNGLKYLCTKKTFWCFYRNVHGLSFFSGYAVPLYLQCLVSPPSITFFFWNKQFHAYYPNTGTSNKYIHKNNCNTTILFYVHVNIAWMCKQALSKSMNH